MFVRCTTCAFVLSALLASPALAQQGAQSPQAGPSSPPGAAAPAGVPQINFLTSTPPGVWQAESVIGEEVYGQDGQKIGTIRDLLVSPRGLVLALVIDLGGMQKTVAVPAPALEFLGGAAPDATATGATAARTAGDAVPQRLTLQLTMQQLKDAPEFSSAGQKR